MKILLTLFTLQTLFTLSSFAQWVQVNNGMGNQLVSSLAANVNTIFAGTSPPNGVYLSSNNGTTWTQTSLINQYIYSLAVNGNTIFAGTNSVYLSTNNGTNWTETTLINQTSVYSLAFSGNTILAGTQFNGVYLSTNNGLNWTQTSLNNQEVRSLAVNGNNIFAGIESPPDGVYLSTNNGISWTQTSLNNQWVNALAVNGNNVFAGTYPNGVYVSTNNGLSWTQTPLNNREVLSLAVNGNNVFAGTYDYGVYVSNNNGASWIQRNEGLGNLNVWSLCIISNYIFAGTALSVYKRPLGELTGIQPISNEVPNLFFLSQNYPNPFNPTTKIRFSLPLIEGAGGRNVKLVVFDILGSEVATLVNEELMPGTYEVDWDASKFSSGVYFYKLVAGDYTDTKKMILIK